MATKTKIILMESVGDESGEEIVDESETKKTAVATTINTPPTIKFDNGAVPADVRALAVASLEAIKSQADDSSVMAVAGGSGEVPIVRRIDKLPEAGAPSRIPGWVSVAAAAAVFIGVTGTVLVKSSLFRPHPQAHAQGAAAAAPAPAAEAPPPVVTEPEPVVINIPTPVAAVAVPETTAPVAVAEAKPVEAEAKPAEAKPAEAKPVSASAVEAKPATRHRVAAAEPAPAPAPKPAPVAVKGRPTPSAKPAAAAPAAPAPASDADDFARLSRLAKQQLGETLP